MTDRPGGAADVERSRFDAAPRDAAGWYPDPLARFDLRFHNGSGWTADVATDGERFVDPAGVTRTAPIPAPPGGSPDAVSSRLGTTSMVLGIVGVSLSWLPIVGIFGAVLALAGIVVGWIAVRRARAVGAESGAGRSRALVGIGTGIGGLAGAVVGIFLTVVVVGVYSDYLDPEPAETRVVACELVGARATAVVEITNVGDERQDYTVVVAFVRPGTDDASGTDRVAIDDLAPGDTATIEAQRQVDLDEIDCVVTDVTGALPFGLALD